MKRFSLVPLILVVFSQTCLAWGRRGHQIVGETAATIVSTEPNADFMRDHSFDFAYYNNVPDFFWKEPKTYDIERPQHYMNLEIFDRAFKAKPEEKNPFELNRQAFDAKFPEIPFTAGRAFWRIRERVAALEAVTDQLKKMDIKQVQARRDLQGKWMVIAGTLGHYVADLSQPLHVSMNYDGEETGQKGVHSFFEDACVDELYPELTVAVKKEVEKRWPKFKKENSNKPLIQLLDQEAKGSLAKHKMVLDIDKRTQRDLKKASRAYQKLIVERLAEGSLYLAEIFRRNLGFSFDNKKFYYFEGEPTWVNPLDDAKRL